MSKKSVSNTVISVSGLCKTFELKKKEPGLKGSIKSIFSPKISKVTAVDNISFSINKGELVALIGPNGAGKSTTLKILTGILFPSSGHAEILGLVPWENRKKLAYQIGTIFGQKSQLWYHLPPIDTFDLFAKIYDLEDTDYRKRLNYLVKVLGVTEFLNTPVRKLSLGQRIRAELVAALLHNPKVLFLDEPSIGLDIIAKKTLRDLIKKLNKEEGVTIILTSHDVDDIEQVCERVIIINQGKIVHDSPIGELKRNHLNKKIVQVMIEESSKKLKQLGVKVLESDKHSMKLEVNTNKVSIAKLVASLMNKYKVTDLLISDPPIEEIIEEIYTKEK
ncbi:ATP-binding cassette domain-containing protein [Candidatus Woesearchaeota archaeon]|nr:ATP-binding cassette domain-containing protein [Candidatus Woesearchaeota archaeon]